MKILIAEDEQMSALLLQEVMTVWGDADVAFDGQRAIELWLQALQHGVLYDLVCLDVMMPKKTGHQVLAQIRELEHDYGIGGMEMVPIVMTTALSDQKNVMQAFLKELCQGYLVKPITPDKMKNELLRLNLISERVDLF